MRTTKRLSFSIILGLLLCIAPAIQAQVTIGMGKEPNAGSLLDLKSQDADANNANASKGLGMPRVKLLSLSIGAGANGNLASTILGASGTWDKDAHIGLMVYHIDKCSLAGKGLYVWDGTAWQRLPKAGNVGSILVNQNSFDFASGLDARGSVIAGQSLTVGWDLAGNLGYTRTNTLGGGVPFSGANTLLVSPWASNPTTINLLPDAMTAADVTATTPWKSKETQLNFVDTECGNSTKTVTLNQTNYAILSYNNAKGLAGATNSLTTASNYIRLTDATTAKTFRIKSNAAWKTTVSASNTIFNHTIPTTGGADITNGTTPPNSDYTLTGIAGTGSKYQTATITIEDTHSPKRAKDVTVTCYSCIGTDASLAGLPTATPAETSSLTDIWGTAIIRHQAKAGVYEEFTSAVFGAAGRWMTTNLSAKAYDGIPHSQGRSLLGPPSNNNTTNLYNVAYWAYPNTVAGGPMDATEYTKNKALGYLYTWDAATAGKGGTTGIVGGNEVGDSHAATNPQGICPAGWHLPSDYEWTVLENAIIQHTSLYSSMADLDPSSATHLAQYTGTTSVWRGTTDATPYHGTAMKEVCETLSSTDPAGASKPASQGGFSAPLAGGAVSGSSINFGYNAYFWSSSSGSAGAAWTRTLYSTQGGVNERSYNRDNLFSVRCKKD